MNWTDYPYHSFDVTWHHPDGWRARLSLTAVGQFVATLTHADNENHELDNRYLEQAHGHEYAILTEESLVQFEKWIEQHGAETLAELPVTMTLTRQQAAALLASDRLVWEGSETPLAVKAALLRLRSELQRGLSFER